MGPTENRDVILIANRYAIGTTHGSLGCETPVTVAKNGAGIALLDPYWSRKMPLLNQQEYLQLPRNFGLQGVGNPMGVSKNF